MPIYSKPSLIYLLYQRFVFGFLAIAPCSAVLAEQVVWHTSNFAPYYVVDGAFKGQGIADQRLNLVMDGLPQWEHQVISGVPVLRTESQMLQQNNICGVTFIKTKAREQYMVFTEQPIIYTLPNGLITTRTRLQLLSPYLNKDGSFALRDFLDNSQHRLGVSLGRNFGQEIDDAIRHARTVRPQALVDVEADNLFRSRLLKLIHQDAFQAMVGYPEELAYFSRQLGLNPDDFVFIPVAGEPPLVAGYVACSRSEFGRSVVAAANTLIGRPSFRHKVQAAYRQWIDSASLSHYNRLMQGK